jgi:hypothetical protein
VEERRFTRQWTTRIEAKERERESKRVESAKKENRDCGLVGRLVRDSI